MSNLMYHMSCSLQQMHSSFVVVPTGPGYSIPSHHGTYIESKHSPDPPPPAASARPPRRPLEVETQGLTPTLLGRTVGNSPQNTVPCSTRTFGMCVRACVCCGCAHVCQRVYVQGCRSDVPDTSHAGVAARKRTGFAHHTWMRFWCCGMVKRDDEISRHKCQISHQIPHIYI